MSYYPPPSDPKRPKPPYPKTPPPWAAMGFAARAICGFLLFFATLILASWAGSTFHNGTAAIIVIASVFVALVVTSFVLHRRGWLTGWLLGFMLSMTLVGLVIYTCRNGWNR